MLEEEVVPNDVSFGAAISACEASLQWQLALQLLSIMPDPCLTEVGLEFRVQGLGLGVPPHN